MKVNLKKVKPLKVGNVDMQVSVIDNGKGCLRNIEATHSDGSLIFFMYHEDARELRDWLNRVLP